MDITVTNPKTGKPQAFEIRIRDINHIRTGDFVKGYSSCETSVPDLCMLEGQIAKAMRASFHDLDFHPLTEEGATTPKANRCNKHYRGGEEYHTHDHRTPDANPFEVRKVKITTHITGHGNGWQGNSSRVYFTSDSYNWTLTDGQKSALETWFSDQLVAGVTGSVLAQVQSEAKEALLTHAKKDIPLIMGWLKLLAEFQG